MGIKLMFNKSLFWCRQHSPELLTAGSVITTAGAIATAIYSTMKLGKILVPHKEKLDQIREDLHNDNKIQNEIVNVKDLKKEMTKEYLKTAGSLAKLYAPTILLYTLSTSCSVSSNRILRHRNIALAAAYTTLDTGYKAYRERVKNKLGEEAEEKLYKNITKETVEEVDPKTGKVKKVTVEKPHSDLNENYNVVFDCGNPCWERDAQINFDFLMNTQAHMNLKLQRQGYLFLADVYDALGFDVGYLGKAKARASHYLGWIYDPKDPERDNYVTFGLTIPGTTHALPKVADQIVHNEAAFFLSLNPDGDILSGNSKMFAEYAK